MVYGLGYGCGTKNTYKVVCVYVRCATPYYFQYQIQYTTLDVQVFALGSSSWKAIIKLPECPPTYLKKWQHIYIHIYTQIQGT